MRRIETLCLKTDAELRQHNDDPADSSGREAVLQSPRLTQESTERTPSLSVFHLIRDCALQRTYRIISPGPPVLRAAHPAVATATPAFRAFAARAAPCGGRGAGFARRSRSRT